MFCVCVLYLPNCRRSHPKKGWASHLSEADFPGRLGETVLNVFERFDPAIERWEVLPRQQRCRRSFCPYGVSGACSKVFYGFVGFYLRFLLSFVCSFLWFFDTCGPQRPCLFLFGASGRQIYVIYSKDKVWWTFSANFSKALHLGSGFRFGGLLSEMRMLWNSIISTGATIWLWVKASKYPSGGSHQDVKKDSSVGWPCHPQTGTKEVR